MPTDPVAARLRVLWEAAECQYLGAPLPAAGRGWGSPASGARRVSTGPRRGWPERWRLPGVSGPGWGGRGGQARSAAAQAWQAEAPPPAQPPGLVHGFSQFLPPRSQAGPEALPALPGGQPAAPQGTPGSTRCGPGMGAGALSSGCLPRRRCFFQSFRKSLSPPTGQEGPTEEPPERPS